MKKSVWIPFFCALVTILLLSPLAELLRTQQPFRCFPLTFDENFYLHSIYNFDRTGELKAYWMPKPMEPILTIGPVFATGVKLTHHSLGKILHLDWPQSARLFTSLCFGFFILLFSWFVLVRSKRVISVLLFLFLSITWFRANPLAGYLSYGVLGEIPAALFWLLGIYFFRGSRVVLSTLFWVMAVLIKPSFFPMLPIALIASVGKHRSFFLKTLISMGVWGALALAYISNARKEGIFTYFSAFMAQTNDVSPVVARGEIFQYFLSQSGFFLVGMILALVLSILVWADSHRRRSLSSFGKIATLLFFFGVFYFFGLGHKPQPKHVFVLFHLGVFWAFLEVSIWSFKRPFRRIEVFALDPTLRACTWTAVLVWLLHVPSQNLRLFRESLIESCPVKQQRELDRRVSQIYEASGKKATIGEITSPSMSHFLYELGFSPPAAHSWSEWKLPYPEWVVGDKEAILPLPNSCRTEWQGSDWILVNCRDLLKK